MTIATIDNEMIEALIKIKKQVPQINAVQLEHIVLSYYQNDEPEFEILETPDSMKPKIKKLSSVLNSVKTQKIVKNKLKKQNNASVCV